MIRVLLVDDHASLRGALALVFDAEPGMTVAAEAGSLAETRALLNAGSAGFDVALLDFDLPDGSGDGLISELHGRNPHAQVLLLSGVADEPQRALAVEAGATGVLHKSAPTEEVVEAVRRLAAGQQLLSPQETLAMLRLACKHQQQELAARRLLDKLSDRERDVLRALAEGLGDKEIAERLGIHARTARNHMARILAKLHVKSRLQALLFAARHGVVSIY